MSIFPATSCPFVRRETAPMEPHEAIRLRTMVRSFSSDPVDPHVADCLLRAALRSPTAGNTAGTAWVALVEMASIVGPGMCCWDRHHAAAGAT